MFSETDFEAHTCDTPLKGCKIIQVTEFYDGSYKDKKLMNGMGTDGVLYTFEVVPRKAIPITIPLNNNPSDDSYHANKNDDKLTEPFSIIFIFHIK